LYVFSECAGFSITFQKGFSFLFLEGKNNRIRASKMFAIDCLRGPDFFCFSSGQRLIPRQRRPDCFELHFTTLSGTRPKPSNESEEIASDVSGNYFEEMKRTTDNPGCEQRTTPRFKRTTDNPALCPTREGHSQDHLSSSLFHDYDSV
jgi:hypothetical protein